MMNTSNDLVFNFQINIKTTIKIIFGKKINT